MVPRKKKRGKRDRRVIFKLGHYLLSRPEGTEAAVLRKPTCQQCSRARRDSLHSGFQATMCIIPREVPIRQEERIDSLPCGGGETRTPLQSSSCLSDSCGDLSHAILAEMTFGATSTGHLGYLKNSSTDTDDYWRLVAPSSDSIYVHVTSDSTLDVDLTAYGPDGTTSLSCDGAYGIYSRVGIKPTAGTTYYFKAYKWSGTAGSYSIVAVRSPVAVGITDESAQNLVPSEMTLE